jgi:Cu/Ag efflux protein CusF
MAATRTQSRVTSRTSPRSSQSREAAVEVAAQRRQTDLDRSSMLEDHEKIQNSNWDRDARAFEIQANSDMRKMNAANEAQFTSQRIQGGQAIDQMRLQGGFADDSNARNRSYSSGEAKEDRDLQRALAEKNAGVQRMAASAQAQSQGDVIRSQERMAQMSDSTQRYKADLDYSLGMAGLGNQKYGVFLGASQAPASAGRYW